MAGFLHRAVQVSRGLQKEAKSKLLKDFLRVATNGDGEGVKAVKELRQDVRAFAMKWPLPGADITTIQKPAGILDD